MAGDFFGGLAEGLAQGRQRKERQQQFEANAPQRQAQLRSQQLQNRMREMQIRDAERMRDRNAQIQAGFAKGPDAGIKVMERIDPVKATQYKQTQANLKRSLESARGQQLGNFKQKQSALGSIYMAIAQGSQGDPNVANRIYQKALPTIRKIHPEAGDNWNQDEATIAIGSAFSPQERVAQKGALAAQQKKEVAALKKQNFTDTGKLRGEFTKLSGTFMDINNAYNRVKAAGSEPSAAGDLALIFNYMKMLDPASVVRESEFATAANAASLPERLRAQKNKILRGERLSTVQRKDFMDRSAKLFKAQRKTQTNLEGEFKRIAEKNGLDAEDVIINLDTASGPDPKKLLKLAPPTLQNQYNDAIKAGVSQEKANAILQSELEKRGLTDA